MGEVSRKGAPTALGKENAALIKRRMVEGYSNVQIAHLFGCSPETVSRIRRGATHKDVRVLGDEVLERHLEREGVAGEARVQIARVDAVEELLKQATPLTAEQGKAAAATMERLAALQAQQEAKEAAKTAKEAEEERLAEELEGKGTSQDVYFAQAHLTGEAKEKIALDLGAGASLKEQPLPTFELTGKVSAEAAEARERAERGE